MQIQSIRILELEAESDDLKVENHTLERLNHRNKLEINKLKKLLEDNKIQIGAL